MADVRESFTTLEGASQEGLALRAVQQGDAVAAKNGSLAFSHQDTSGNAKAAPIKVEGNAKGDAIPTLPAIDPSNNLQYLKVNAAGQLSVTSEAVGNALHAHAKIAGNASLTDIATITLTADKRYENFDFLVACFRDAIFQVVQIDDATETILAEVLCGPGQFSFHGKLEELEILAGSTGTQEVVIRGQNVNALSDLRATISVKELG